VPIHTSSGTTTPFASTYCFVAASIGATGSAGSTTGVRNSRATDQPITITSTDAAREAVRVTVVAVIAVTSTSISVPFS